MAIEKKIKLVPYEIHMFCECGGEFIQNHKLSEGAKMFFGFPNILQKFKYTCNKCGAIELFDEEYPKIIYECE